MKKVKGIIISSLIALSIIMVMPFSVSANSTFTVFTIDDIVGTNARIEDNGNGTYYNYVDIVFNDHYIGKAKFRIRYRLGTGSYTTVDRTVSFNDTHVEVMILSSNQSIDIANTSVTQVTVSNSVYKYNEFLMNFPYESMNFIIEMASFGYEVVDIYNLGEYKFPIFKVPAGGEITHKYLTPDPNSNNHYATVVLWVNKSASGISSMLNYFTYTANFNVTNYRQLNVFNYDGVASRLIKFDFQNGDIPTGNYTNGYIYASVDLLIMPIYLKRGSELGFESNDFAQNFGLTNKYLNTIYSLPDWLQTIINTLQGDSSVQDSIDANDDVNDGMSESISDVIGIEEDLGSGFSTAVENIPSSFNFSNNFGARFMSSATWVRDRFDFLTVNTPFGSLITFSLILGVALLLFGRIML